MARPRRCRPGGIAGLCELLDEHAGAVEADLRRYYGANLADLFNGTLTWRQVAAWIEHLPHDSALARSYDGEAAIWGLHGQLLAAIADLLAVSNWQRAGCKGAAPTPIRRPGIEPEGNVHGGETGLDNEAVMEILHGYRTGAYAQQDDIDEG